MIGDHRMLSLRCRSMRGAGEEQPAQRKYHYSMRIRANMAGLTI